MHYTGTIWRPPYEAGSLLLQVTAGCTHHKCKFCTLYHDLPFRFRLSPLRDIEADLQEAQLYAADPIAKLSARLQGLPEPDSVKRVFLVGANPFVLHFRRLKEIAELIRRYLPACESIGCFARVTDVGLKTDGELSELRELGFDGLSIGVESGSDAALAFMNKGYLSGEIVRQTARLDRAGIAYCFMYLAGLAGAGRCREAALESAAVFNRTHPRLIGSSMLTVYPESELFQEIQAGNWREAGELEKLEEVQTLIEHLEIPVQFATLGASNAVLVQGLLPGDRAKLAAQLEKERSPEHEAALEQYRKNLKHL